MFLKVLMVSKLSKYVIIAGVVYAVYYFTKDSIDYGSIANYIQNGFFAIKNMIRTR